MLSFLVPEHTASRVYFSHKNEQKAGVEEEEG
jgi:hypothetical protein